jgi:ATP-binding cassette subfamily B protein
MTKIIIAQRITSVMDADKILVIDHGKAVGLGTHEQLLSTCEIYKDIYEIQMAKEVG